MFAIKWLAALAFTCASSAALAATVSYSNRVTFLSAVGSTNTDSYENGYEHGDLIDTPTLDRFSNTAMSAVLGETAYLTTGDANANIVITSGSNRVYCAGCNGSFQLNFQNTSLSGTGGVYGFGVDYWNQGTIFSPSGVSYTAFVTFGDGTQQNYSLAQLAFNDTTFLFFGLTSDLLIASVAFGLPNGGATTEGSFGIDNLTLAASTVPVPPALPLFATGLVAFGWLARRKKKQAA